MKLTKLSKVAIALQLMYSVIYMTDKDI